MKKIILITLISLISYTSYTQINYEKGYFIDTNGKRTECLIKNVDWASNPTKFQYKLSEKEESITEYIKHINEFGIHGTLKYQRFTVEIDRSSHLIDNMSNVRKPNLKKEILFLKVLAEGNANLYSYEGKNLKRFFYKMDSVNIEQLIYKEYRSSDLKISKNKRYKQQLWKHLKCQTISLKTIESINYRAKDLIDLFSKFNSCGTTEFVNLDVKKKKGFLKLTIRAGISTSSLVAQIPHYNDIEFDTELSYRLGTEIEYIMPFNKNKWAILVEPTFQHYKSEKVLSNGIVAKIDYKSIEFPIGIRHYFFITNKSKIFINGIYTLDFPFDSKFYSERININVKTANTANFTVGLGYTYNNLSLELRHGLSRNIFTNYSQWTSDYRSSSLILGYTLF